MIFLVKSLKKSPEHFFLLHDLKVVYWQFPESSFFRGGHFWRAKSQKMPKNFFKKFIVPKGSLKMCHFINDVTSYCRTYYLEGCQNEWCPKNNTTLFLPIYFFQIQCGNTFNYLYYTHHYYKHFYSSYEHCVMVETACNKY